MHKSIGISLLLVAAAIGGSGCATILGGIIGYQSGELCAGLAIGAAIDFTDEIVRGVGQMTAKKEDLCRDFREKAEFDTQGGEITLPICPFSRQRVMEIVAALKEKFEENGWTYNRIMKTTNKNLLGPYHWKEEWKVTTENQRPFTFEIKFNSDRDTRFLIRSVSCNEPEQLTPEEQMTITGRIYGWMEEIVLARCPEG
jgi:hypothetical protein